MPIALKEIRKSYGSSTIVQVPFLQLDHGIYWLKGINGSGKTTLMKLIAGLLPFEGDVLLDASVSLKKNRMTYLRFVNYAEAEPVYPPFLTGKELLQLFIKTKGTGKEQANSLVDILQVSSFMDHPAGTYSSGMMKKISLLLAFTGKPKLILLDEPLVTIDDKTIPAINKLIHDYHAKYGVTFLLTSHQAFESTAFPITHRLLMEDHAVKTIS